MALRTDPYGNMFCSDCSGRVENDWSVGKLIGVFFLGDIITWVIAGLFVLIGMLWTPAYILAAVIATFAMIKGLRNQERYICSSCKRAFTHQQARGH